MSGIKSKLGVIAVARGVGGNPPKFSEKIRAREKSGKNSKTKGKILEKTKKLGKMNKIIRKSSKNDFSILNANFHLKFVIFS